MSVPLYTFKHSHHMLRYNENQLSAGTTPNKIESTKNHVRRNCILPRPNITTIGKSDLIAITRYEQIEARGQKDCSRRKSRQSG